MRQRVGILARTAVAAALLWPALSRADITISEIWGAGDPWCKTVSIAVAITSTYSLTSVTATVGNLTVPLVYTSGSRWSADVPLDDVSFGDFQVTVTALDSHGGSASLPITHRKDCWPRIVLVEPVAYTVARPWVHIQATCEDDGPAGCASMTVSAWEENGTAEWQLAANPLDVWHSLSGWSNPVSISIIAYDSGGLHSTVEIPIWVDESPEQVTIDRVGGRIEDVDETRILFQLADGRWAIRDRATGTDTWLVADSGPLQDGWPGDQWGFLTPSGAMFRARGGDSCSCDGDVIVDWRDGERVDLACAYSNHALQVNGSFAAYLTCSGGLYFRDLVAGTSAFVDDSAYTEYDVSADGKVAYRNWDGVAIYAAGATTQLPIQVSRQLGINSASMVYCSPSGLMLYDLASSTESLLAVASTVLPDPTFQLYGGTIAYPDIKPPDIAVQVWLRQASGDDVRATDLGFGFHIDRLGHDNELMAFNSSMTTRFWAAPGQDIVTVGSNGGRAFHLGDQWLVAIGRNLFCVPSVSATPCPGGLDEPLPPPQSDAGVDDALAADDAVEGDGGTGLGADAGTRSGSDGCGCAAATAAKVGWVALLVPPVLVMRRRQPRVSGAARRTSP